MPVPFFRRSLAAAALREETLRGIGLALRGAVVFMVPFLAGLALGAPREGVFAAFSAHSIALVDVEGPYVLRLNLLCLLALAFTASAGLGTLAAGSLPAAVLVTGLLGLSVGAWRQLCRDYGPMAAVPCSLILFTALGLAPLGTSVATLGPAAARHALATLAGGLFGVACLLLHWPLRPQYPLRRLVGRNWIGLAGLARAVGRDRDNGGTGGGDAAGACTDGLRATLDAAFAQLAPLTGPDAHPFWNNLAALNLAAARFASRLTALDALLPGLDVPREAGLPGALERLARAANTVAHVVVRPRPGSVQVAGVAMADARQALARAADILNAAPADRRLAALVLETSGRFAEVEKALRQVSRLGAERAAFRDQRRHAANWIVRPLRGAFSWRRLDPALLRYTLGLSALLVAATALFKGFGLPHGSWLPFSMLVVLQPSARLTRARMAHRVTGTVAGALVAGLPVWHSLPLPWLLTAIGACCAVFTYLMRRHYGTAVFFITLTVVLMTGLDASQPWHLAVERLGCVLCGSLAAWALASSLWPKASANQIEGPLDAALRANRVYLEVVSRALAVGGRRFHEASVEAKRRAERANKALPAALAEWRGQPGPDVSSPMPPAVLAAFSPKLTAMLTVLFLQQEADASPVDDPDARTLSAQALAALEALTLQEPRQTGPLGTAKTEDTSHRPPQATAPRPDVVRQLRDIRDAVSQVASGLAA